MSEREKSPPADVRAWLDRLYRRYNRRKYLSPDPLEVVYRYERPADREIAGLIAALLAYGGVRQIVRSAGRVLDALQPSPAEAVGHGSPREWRRSLQSFRHRWTSGLQIVGLLTAVREIGMEFGSLNAAFLAACRPGDPDLFPALERWTHRLIRAGGAGCGALLPDPAKGSACKRLHLYLRWMVRRDEVDPGVWTGVSPARLTVPLDVHLHRAARILGLTRRRSADRRTAREITEAFRRLHPADPVRWDFALNRAAMKGYFGESASGCSLL